MITLFIEVIPFGTLMLIDQIQKFPGHSKTERTQVYAESTAVMIKEGFQLACVINSELVQS